MNDSTTYEVTFQLQTSIINPIQITILILIFLFSIGYTIVILIYKTFRLNKLNWPIINVCLTTAFFACNQLIFSTARLGGWSIINCRYEGFIVFTSVCEMMYAHCVASFNRLLAIRYFNKLLFRSSHWLLMTIIIGWFIGLVSAIPFAFFDGFICSVGGSVMFLKIYTAIITLVIPIFIVTLCNISIFRYIHQISRRVHDTNNNKNNQSLSRKRDSHVSKVMVLTFCIFVIGWTPAYLEQLLINTQYRVPKNVSLFFTILLLGSLLANMILLIYSNQSIRQMIKKTLTCNGNI